MKEVRVKQLYYQKRQIEKRRWLDETIKQNIERESTKDKEVAPAVKIVIE